MADPNPEQPPIERNFGPQPLDALMLEHGLSNHDLVAACSEPLTHKAVQRARKGRRLTAPMQKRIAQAFHKAIGRQEKTEEREWRVNDLFTY